MTLHRGDRLGDWVVDRPLGAGGMGSVYRCHSVLASDVFAAVKVLTEAGSADFQKRFVQEMRTLAALNHPAIVKVLGGGRDDARGLLYMAMELVDGEDLADRLARGMLSADEAVAIFEPVAGALAYAHERGVAHRDIKPANIMLRADGTPVIVDFGIAVASGHTRITQEGMLPGTMVYLPPEAFEGQLPDPKSTDAYALGIVMWEALTGEQPFATDPSSSQGAAMAQVMGQKIRSEALDPGASVPEGLRQAVMLTTDPEPDSRLNDLSKVRSLLTSGDDVVRVRPRKRRKKGRGVRIFAGLAAALVMLGGLGLVLVAVVGLGLGLWLYSDDGGPVVERGPPVDLAATVADAASALERGDLRTARESAGAALDDHPEDPTANLVYGQLLLVEDRVLLARPYLCSAVAGGIGSDVPGFESGDLDCERGPGASMPLSSPMLAARLDLGAQIAASRRLIDELEGDAVAEAEEAPAAAPAPQAAPAPAPPPRPTQVAKRRPEPSVGDAVADAEVAAAEPARRARSAKRVVQDQALDQVASSADDAEAVGLPAGSGAPMPAAKQAPIAGVDVRLVAGSELDVRGELDRNVVIAVIKRQLGQVKYCYETRLKSTPRLAGRVTIDFNIATDGHVTNPKVKSSTVGDGALHACLVARVARWRFPADYGGATGVTFSVDLGTR